MLLSFPHIQIVLGFLRFDVEGGRRGGVGFVRFFFFFVLFCYVIIWKWSVLSISMSITTTISIVFFFLCVRFRLRPFGFVFICVSVCCVVVLLFHFLLSSRFGRNGYKQEFWALISSSHHLGKSYEVSFSSLLFVTCNFTKMSPFEIIYLSVTD